jgi:hypothetical protein
MGQKLQTRSERRSGTRCKSGSRHKRASAVHPDLNEISNWRPDRVEEFLLPAVCRRTGLRSNSDGARRSHVTKVMRRRSHMQAAAGFFEGSSQSPAKSAKPDSQRTMCPLNPDGGRGGNRTHNPRLRRPVLYPIELLARGCASAIVTVTAARTTASHAAWAVKGSVPQPAA